MRIRKTVGHEIPGGWHYPIPDGGPVIKTDKVDPTEAVEDLCKKVKEYRIQNGLPAGDPMTGIISYYGIHYPFAIEFGKDPEVPSTNELEQSLLSWIREVWKSPPKSVVDAHVAEERASCCQGCPFRVDPPYHGPEGVEARRRAFLLARGHPMEHAGCCSYWKWDNSLACWLPHSKKDSPIPAQCFLNDDHP